MILASRTLLTLLALTPYINATRLNSPDNLSPANAHDSVNDITGQFSTIYLADFESNAARGLRIWTDNLGNDMKTIVMALDSEITKVTKHPDSANSATALLHGFLEASGVHVDKIVDNIVKTAVALRTINLLQTLTMLYVWSSPEQFHWFRALGYKSEWYNEPAWKDAPVPMDWNKNLHTVFMADNPILLNDLRSGIFPENSLTITNSLSDLIAEHDSLAIYQSLVPTPAINLETLIKSGSFKILRFLAESQSIDLHLEDYHPPHTLPEDFKFFWMQGYRYLSADYFLRKACEYGREDILEFFFQIGSNIMDTNIMDANIMDTNIMDTNIMNPSNDHLILAAKNGHLNILEWALNHNLPVNITVISALILNGYLDAFEQLQEQLKLSAENLQEISDCATEQGSLNVVKWLYEKFKIVPELYPLSETDNIELLEWIEPISPQLINEELASLANVTILKWILKTHPHLLTEHVKDRHNVYLVNFEELKWMVLQGWKVNPDCFHATLHGNIEMLRFAYNILLIRPTKNDAKLAASNGHIEILKLIYSIDSSCISKGALSKAIRRGFLETAKYLESILKLKDERMNFNPWIASRSGDLEAIKWAYQNYKLDPPTESHLKWPIKCGRLPIINWAIENQFILKTDETYLEWAAEFGRYPIFKRLVDYGITITKAEDYISLAFNFGSLELVKYLAEKSPGSARILKNQEIHIRNYHIALWLRNHNFWTD